MRTLKNKWVFVCSRIPEYLKKRYPLIECSNFIDCGHRDPHEEVSLCSIQECQGIHVKCKWVKISKEEE